MKKAKIILIAGGSASGKTSVARDLTEIVGKKSSVTLFEIDNYYLPKAEALKKNQSWEIVDYDNPKSVNWDLFLEDLKTLQLGKDVVKAVYDYDKEDYKEETVTLKAADVIIIEGIFALAVRELVDMGDLRIFVHADNDTRFVRRLKRDQETRYNISVDDFMNRWTNILKPSHNKFIEPTKSFADFIINTESLKEKHIPKVLKTLVTLGGKD